MDNTDLIGYDLKIYSLTGQLILERKLLNGASSVNISVLNTGVYNLVITGIDNKQKVNIKLVKE
ncbi:MAG: T9SS type A sorting domain-containing protein [Bacteroidales bacterium]|nr:T9SS type A sorting domain-containing protein [Bacteroidales bacterium]